MYRGTTPTITINIKNEDIQLSSMKEIWVTLKSLRCEKTYSKVKNELAVIEDENHKQIQIVMSQEDTLKFVNGSVKLQVRFLDVADRAYTTNIVETSMNGILKDGEIYG